MPLDASIFGSGWPQQTAPPPLPQPAPQAQPAAPAAVGAAPAAKPPPATAVAPPPDPLDSVLAHIAGGETGGSPDPYRTLYGGNLYGFPQWGGATGPGGEPTHAAGRLQWEPATWSRAASGYQATTGKTPDFNSPADQNAVSKFWASKVYRQKTGRSLAADAAAGKVDYSALAGEWPSLGGRRAGAPPGDLGPLGEEARQARERQAADYRAASDESAKMLAKINPDDPELDKRISAALDKTNALTDRMLESLQHPPQPPTPEDAFKKLGSPAALIGILAGFMGRRHAIDSFSAAAAAISAGNQGDWNRYEVAHQVWKDNLQTLTTVSQLQQQSIRNILEDRHVALNERLAMARAKMDALGLRLQADALETQGADAAWKFSMQLSAQNAKMQQYLEKLDLAQQRLALQEQQAANKGWQLTTPPGGGSPVWVKPPAPGEPEGETRPSGIEPGSIKFGAAPPVQLSDADINFWANVLRNGGSLPPGIARLGAGSQIVQRIMAAIPGQAGGDPGAFIAGHATQAADASSLRNMTKMADAATSFERTATENFDLALSLSKDAVPTDWGPWLNKFIETGETQAGNKGVPAYVTAMLTAANEYAKIMSGSTGAQGSTVDSRREAAELFSPYLSAGQIDRVVAVAKADMANRKQSLYGQIDDIKARLRAGGASQAPTATMGQAPGAAAPSPPPTGPKSGNVPPLISTKEEYDALPPHAAYKWREPDGNITSRWKGGPPEEQDQDGASDVPVQQ